MKEARMDATAVFESCKAGLVEMPLSLLWRGYGSAIFLEFGALTPAGKRRDGSNRNLKGEFTIGIEWTWRIEDHSSIVCGSSSDEDQWERAFDLIRSHRLRRLTAFARIPELDLEFDNAYHLLSFKTSEGQPDWYIIDWRRPKAVTLMVDKGKLAIEAIK